MKEKSSHCPTCHSPIPTDAPGGLCPACSLEKAASLPSTGSRGRQSATPAIEDVALHFPELEILELLGVGGMGAVYQARQPRLDRVVALKILSHELAQDPAFVERFNREAKMLARLSHPNVVGVFDFGTAGPYCFLLMEYVDGVNLRQAMRTGGFQPAEALALVQDVCAALQYAHDEGILHRDIKPENVLLDSKGRVKIADFGIAKLVGAGTPSDVTLTLQGSILGSPHYMAPEQIETPGDVDQRADIYSLGVVLYEMLTGELPIGRFALPSEKAAMDARIDEIVLRTLAKAREARFQSAGEVGTQVAAVASRPPAASPASTVPPSPAGAPGDSGMARFSLLSVILTGTSVILLVVFLYFWNTRSLQAMTPASYAQSQSTAQKLIPAVLLLAPGLISALVGFIFGAVAMGDVRQSGGRKKGLGCAIFAVVTWPIGFLAMLILSFLVAPMPGSGRGEMTMVFALLVTGMPLPLASFVLIRGLRRWARGVVRKGGHRHFPGLTGTVLATLGLAFLGPVLAVVVPRLLSDSGSSDRFGHRGAPGPPLVSTVSRVGSEETWLHGSPDMVVPVHLPAGVRANFLLVARNEKGGQTTTTIGQLNIRSAETVMVTVGAVDNSGSANESAPELAVALRSASQHFMVSTGTDRRGWEFFQSVPGASALSGNDRREFELANRPGTSETPSGVMHLVVETTPLK